MDFINQIQANDSHVLASHHHHTVMIGLNRPKALNSLNHEMIHSVQKTLDEAKENRDIRVVLFYGEGKLGFSPAVGTLTHRSSSNP